MFHQEVRVQGNLVFFELGEDGPSATGIVSTTELRAVMEVEALRGMLGFLEQKISNSADRLLDTDSSARKDDKPSEDSENSLSVRRRIKIEPSSSKN